MKSQGSNPFSADYRRIFGNSYIRQFDVYVNQAERANQAEKIGQVMDVRTDEAGRLQYLVVSLVAPISKLVLLPLHQTQVEQQSQRVYLRGLSKEQVINLPAYNPTQSDQQARRSVASRAAAPTLETAVPLENAAPLETRSNGYSTPVASPSTVAPEYDLLGERYGDRSNQSINQPSNSASHLPLPTEAGPTVRLYEERLVVDRGKRQKAGEVIVRKEIGTRMIEVPVRYEKLIVEQISPAYEQLAVVDLKADDSVAVDANGAIAHATDQSSISSEFTSAEAASQFLYAMAQQHDSGQQTIQIKIINHHP